MVTLQQHTTCKTSSVIYLIECSKCNEQYVGETGHPVHHRGNQHWSDIQGGHKNIPSVRHFKKCGVENLKLMVLEKVRSQNQEIRKARESSSILRLNPAINKLTTWIITVVFYLFSLQYVSLLSILFLYYLITSWYVNR